MKKRPSRHKKQPPEKSVQKHKNSRSRISPIARNVLGAKLKSAFAPPQRLSKGDVSLETAIVSKSIFNDTIAQVMMDSVPTAVVVLNEFRQIVFANQTFLDFVAAKRPEDVLGKRPGEAVGCIHSMENEAGCGTTEFCSMCGAVQAILISQEGGNAYRECRISTPRGISLDLAVSASPLVIEGKSFTLFAAVDISHEKRRRLLEKTFFHDILNTSSVLYAYAEALHDGEPKAIERAGEKIYSATNRLIDEIQAQRQLLSAENNELTIILRPVAVRNILTSTAESYAAHPAAYGKLIEVDASSEDVECLSDAALLSRVISNMVKNALEATPAGGKVVVSCHRAGNKVEISVNNPSFMPREIQLQLFQRSFSTKGAGRGIGTYSMKLLSEKYLGGKITFTSEKDSGTTFTASYPLKGK